VISLLTLSNVQSQNCMVWIDNYADATCPSSCDGSADAMAAVMPNSNPTFLWQPGGMTTASVYNLCPGTYTVTLTTTNCQSFAVHVVGSGGASLNAIPSNASCQTCANGSAIANVNGGVAPYSYMWSPGGQTTQTATGLLPGTYTVSVSDNSGCGAVTQTVIVGYNTTTGITDVSNGGLINIYPVPVTDNSKLTILDNSFAFPYTLKVIDLTGKEVVIIHNITTPEYDFKKDQLNPGIYFLTVISNNKLQISRKLIIQ
jgi:hypothetical protein